MSGAHVFVQSERTVAEALRKKKKRIGSVAEMEDSFHFLLKNEDGESLFK